MPIEPKAWTGEMPQCPRCLAPVAAMSSALDNLSRKLHFYVACHAQSVTVSIGWEEIHKDTNLLVVVQGRLVQLFGRVAQVPERVSRQMKVTAEAQVYERPKRKITLEE